MDERKMTIINSILYTLEQISIRGHEDAERVSGIHSGLLSLRGMLQEEARQAAEAASREASQENAQPPKTGKKEAAVNG